MRRAWLGVAVMAVVIALAAGGAALLQSGDDDEQAKPGISTPIVARNVDALASLTLPTGWRELPVVATAAPRQIMVVGTADRPDGAEPISACDPAMLGVDAAFVSVYEYDTGDQLDAPDHRSTYDATQFLSRPADFSTSQPSGGGMCAPFTAGAVDVVVEDPTATSSTTVEPASTTTMPPAPPTGREADFAFLESGRFFVVRVIASGNDSEARFAEAITVLNGLDIALPPEAATTTTAVPVPDAPVPTTVVGSVDAEAVAKQGITDALRGAFGGGGPLTSEMAIHGGRPFGPESQPRVREEKKEYIGVIVPRVNWLTLDAPDHATINFDLLIDGQTITANTTAYALFVDGLWRLPLEVFCEIAHRGGVACPQA